MIKEIRYLETCTAGYFAGSPHVVLTAPINPGMTWAELKESLAYDANSADFGVENWDGFTSALDTRFDGMVDLSEPIDLIDHAEMAREWNQAVLDESKDTVSFMVEGEHMETVYAYFAIIQDD